MYDFVYNAQLNNTILLSSHRENFQIQRQEYHNRVRHQKLPRSDRQNMTKN
jgi:hypothetical protein